MSNYDTILGKGIAQGIEKAIEKGIEQGIEQGIAKEKITVVLNAFANNLSVKMVAIIPI